MAKKIAFFLILTLMLTACGAEQATPAPDASVSRPILPDNSGDSGGSGVAVNPTVQSSATPTVQASATTVTYHDTGFSVRNSNGASCPIVSYDNQPSDLYLLPGCSLGNFFSGATVELSILNPAGININLAGGNINSMNPGFVVDNLNARTGYLGSDYAIWQVPACDLNGNISAVIEVSGIPGGQNLHLEAICLGILPTSTPGAVEGDPANPGDGGGGGPGGGGDGTGN